MALFKLLFYDKLKNLRRLIALFDEKYKDLESSAFVTQLLAKHENHGW